MMAVVRWVRWSPIRGEKDRFPLDHGVWGFLQTNDFFHVYLQVIDGVEIQAAHDGGSVEKGLEQKRYLLWTAED